MSTFRLNERTDIISCFIPSQMNLGKCQEVEKEYFCAPQYRDVYSSFCIICIPAVTMGAFDYGHTTSVQKTRRRMSAIFNTATNTVAKDLSLQLFACISLTEILDSLSYTIAIAASSSQDSWKI